jgi:hypothetical protein
MQSSDYLVWIDLEMTGLKPDTDVIIEMATIVTDLDLNTVAEGPVIAIHQPPEILDAMDEWNKRTHGASGLIERVRSSTYTMASAEKRTLESLTLLVEPGSFQTDIWTRNVLIGQKTLDGSSPNRTRGEKMKGVIQKIRKRDPVEVARLIARIAQDTDPRLRYLVGPDAHIQLWLKRVLPWKWHESLLARLLKID